MAPFLDCTTIVQSVNTSPGYCAYSQARGQHSAVKACPDWTEQQRRSFPGHVVTHWRPRPLCPQTTQPCERDRNGTGQEQGRKASRARRYRRAPARRPRAGGRGTLAGCAPQPPEAPTGCEHRADDERPAMPPTRPCSGGSCSRILCIRGRRAFNRLRAV